MTGPNQPPCLRRVSRVIGEASCRRFGQRSIRNHPAESFMRCRVALFLALLLGSAAQAQEFPYDRDLVLDARPMRGSKRVPVLSVAANGEAQIDLWCKRGSGQAVIGGGVHAGTRAGGRAVDPRALASHDMEPARRCPHLQRRGDAALSRGVELSAARKGAASQRPFVSSCGRTVKLRNPFPPCRRLASQEPAMPSSALRQPSPRW
jgi:hypothetical protein